MLPSEMIVKLLDKPLTDDEEASIEFMTDYRNKIHALISVYNDALLESHSYKVLMNMRDGMNLQNIRFLENKYMEFTEARYELPANYQAVYNSLHEHVQGYYDMLIEEPYMVGTLQTKPLDKSVESVLKMQDTLINVKQDNNLYPAMQNHFIPLFLDTVKGSESTHVFDENGVVKYEYQEQWKLLSGSVGVLPTVYFMLPIVEEMEATGWKSSKSWDEFDYDKIEKALELARDGELKALMHGGIPDVEDATLDLPNEEFD